MTGRQELLEFERLFEYERPILIQFPYTRSTWKTLLSSQCGMKADAGASGLVMKWHHSLASPVDLSSNWQGGTPLYELIFQNTGLTLNVFQRMLICIACLVACMVRLLGSQSCAYMQASIWNLDLLFNSLALFSSSLGLCEKRHLFIPKTAPSSVFTGSKGIQALASSQQLVWHCVLACDDNSIDNTLVLHQLCKLQPLSKVSWAICSSQALCEGWIILVNTP